MGLRDLSLQRKLMGIIMLTTVVALVLASAAFLTYDLITFRRDLAADFGLLADAIGANATDRFVLTDRDGVAQILGALKDHRHVISAWVVDDDDGEVFASYHRDPEASTALPADLLTIEDEHRFADGRLLVARSMRYGEQLAQRAGTFYLITDLEGSVERMRDYLRILVLVLTGVSLVAFFFSSALQRVVSRPILGLVSVARRVSESEDYAIRAAPAGRDEVGKLIDGFNRMLDQIQVRDDELRIARDRAEQANRAKSVFLANMSHELRTPLTAIIGYSEMLEEDARELEMPELLPDLRKIQSAGKHLLGLINSVLDLSKIEAGKMELLVEPLELVDLTREVAETMAPLMEKRGNRLTVDCPDEVGIIHADQTKVRQILLNLLSNAAKFTRGGEVRLELARTDSEEVTIRVADTGIGMSGAQLARLFRPFTQADAATTRDYGGTGLGLALTRRYVELMGGRIEVESESGVGTAFTVALPALVDPRTTRHALFESGTWPPGAIRTTLSSGSTRASG